MAQQCSTDVRGRGVHVLYEFVRLPGFSATVGRDSRKQLLAMATSASVPCVCDCLEVLCRLRHLELCTRSLTKFDEGN